MEFKTAKIKDQNLKFAVIAVQQNVFTSENKETLRKRFEHVLNVPVVFTGELFAKHFDGNEAYVQILERKDILEINDLPWESIDL